MQFDDGLAVDTAYRQKQAAMLFSKNRFAAAQACALLEDGHALELAAHANAMAAQLAERMASVGAPAAYPLQSNEIFVWLTPAMVDRLKAAEVAFAPWDDMRSAYTPEPPPQLPDAGLYRFVASFRTTADDIEAVARALGHNA